MKKSEYRFHKDARDQIKEDNTKDKGDRMFYDARQPIYIPRRKKFKRS